RVHRGSTSGAKDSRVVRVCGGVLNNRRSGDKRASVSFLNLAAVRSKIMLDRIEGKRAMNGDRLQPPIDRYQEP
ncbi:MAG: hypothetical protein KGL62_16365, partial [Bradyrhizobium sp.]|uniref:hypothetical protein n=1 Tax=Bradyrhizobium sp. TaxID=376 RepID=UPI0023A5FA7A